MGCKISKKQAVSWYNGLEQITKVMATVVALFALIGFFVPPLGTLINVFTAWRFGAVGYVYYEIGKNRAPTGDGQFYLLRSNTLGTYKDISMGDKFQAVTPVNFRELPRTDNSPIVFVLDAGDCVTVLAHDHEKFPLQDRDAVSGGWFKVATTACGLFK